MTITRPIVNSFPDAARRMMSVPILVAALAVTLTACGSEAYPGAPI